MTSIVPPIMAFGLLTEQQRSLISTRVIAIRNKFDRETLLIFVDGTNATGVSIVKMKQDRDIFVDRCDLIFARLYAEAVLDVAR